MIKDTVYRLFSSSNPSKMRFSSICGFPDLPMSQKSIMGPLISSTIFLLFPFFLLLIFALFLSHLFFSLYFYLNIFFACFQNISKSKKPFSAPLPPSINQAMPITVQTTQPKIMCALKVMRLYFSLIIYCFFFLFFFFLSLFLFFFFYYCQIAISLVFVKN